MIFFDAIPPEQHASYTVVYEARAVHDSATLRLSDYDKSGGWFVAEVIPDKGSGSATIPGAYIDAHSGNLVNPGEADTVVVKKGRWRAVGSAKGSTRTSGSYSWHEPQDPVSRVRNPEDVYSPFALGGTIVFRPTPRHDDVQWFGANHLIFPEWAHYAVETFNAAPRLQQALSAVGEANSDELKQLLGAENSVSATLAFQAWLASPRASAEQGADLFTNADSRRLSTFAYLSITQSPAQTREQWAAVLSRLARDSRRKEQLLAIAYAAYAVNLFDSRDAAAIAASREIISALRERRLFLDLASDPYSPWHTILGATPAASGPDRPTTRKGPGQFRP